MAEQQSSASGPTSALWTWDTVSKCFPVPQKSDSFNWKVKVNNNSQLQQPRQLIIHTGGTLGCSFSCQKENPTASCKCGEKCALVPADKGELTTFLRTTRGFEDLRPESEYFSSSSTRFILELDPLIDSSNAGPNEWNLLGILIELRRGLYSSFVIIHGTDTLAFTASALSFMLQDQTNYSIVVTGSQTPIYTKNTDAISNLIGACSTIDLEIYEVLVYMHFKLMHGNRIVKIHSSNYDAFHTPNVGVLGFWNGGWNLNKAVVESIRNNRIKIDFMDIQLRYFDQLHKSYLQRVRVNANVHIIHLYPACINLINCIDMGTCEGLVIVAYGTGNAHYDVKAKLQQFRQQGIPVVICTECHQGSVASTYACGLDSTCGVAVFDMTVEAAYTRLLVGVSAGDISVRRTFKDLQEKVVYCDRLLSWLSNPLRGCFTTPGADARMDNSITLYIS